MLHVIGCAHLLNGDNNNAMEYFVNRLKVQQKADGLVCLVANTLFNMAFLHQTGNCLGKARKSCEQALKFLRLRLPNNKQVALIHEMIGTLAVAIGRKCKAEIFLEGALCFRCIIHGNENEAVANILQEMGTCIMRCEIMILLIIHGER